MAVVPNGFEPTSKISNGKKGLCKKQGTHSDVTITGSGLSNNLDVVVKYPATGTATLQWTEKTKSTNPGGTECTVRLKEDLAEATKPPPRRTGVGPDTVSVTVGGVPITPNPTVNIGGLPLCVPGLYVVGCSGTGGTKTDLTGAGGAVALVTPPNPEPNWTFTLLDNNAENNYTIQWSNNQYLSWSVGGSVTLAATAGAATTWQLTTGPGVTRCIMATSSPQKYLNGNTSTGAVNVQDSADPSGGTNWMLTPAAFV